MNPKNQLYFGQYENCLPPHLKNKSGYDFSSLALSSSCLLYSAWPSCSKKEASRRRTPHRPLTKLTETTCSSTTLSSTSTARTLNPQRSLAFTSGGPADELQIALRTDLGPLVRAVLPSVRLPHSIEKLLLREFAEYHENISHPLAPPLDILFNKYPLNAYARNALAENEGYQSPLYYPSDPDTEGTARTEDDLLGKQIGFNMRRASHKKSSRSMASYGNLK